MMRQYELVERVEKYIENPNEALLNKAYVYAMQKHGEQKRASGDPYFSHPLEVAAILTDLHLDEETIAVALLHDTIEDTDATRREIDGLFGEKIGALVEGLTKLKRLDLVSQKAKQAENLRRFLLATADDIRVLLVKLADRLHNMRTLGVMRPDKSRRIATETMEIYAPLAGRMGMQDLRDELEQLSFRYINPEAYQTVIGHLEELSRKSETLTSEISQSLENLLIENNIKARVSSRQKKPYSVFRKMEAKSLSFEQLSDIYGFRLIVKNKEDCYRALGVVHTHWPMVPGRFKDFISVPKQNEYQSIHTTVVGPSRQRVELQIRTEHMHQIAEYGIAAHADYKEGNGVDFANSAAYASLRKTISQLAEADNPEEFLEHTKLELFLDQVFCFTPKGQIIALPKGATPIDFAYAVHTDIGNSCIGCKLNGKVMPVVTQLRNGDEVEIIRSKSQSPPAAWQSVVVTGKARSCIRRASRNAAHRQFSAIGSRTLERVFDMHGHIYTPEDVEAALPRLARSSLDDLLAHVGRGEIDPLDVLAAVDRDWVRPDALSSDGMGSHVSADHMAEQNHPASFELPILGSHDDLPLSISKEGGALPGEKIVGILEPGVGITVYPAEANAVKAFEDDSDRLVDLTWDMDKAKDKKYSARFVITARHTPGTLAMVATAIAAHDGNITNFSISVPADDFAEMQFDVEVWNVNHLERILRELASKPSTAKVTRIFG